jgi:hypothetical protein
MTSYAVRVAASLESQDGQRLGYPWLGLIENWHERAFTSFGDGHGVWEQSGGNQLPFFVRNFQDIRQWVTGISPENLMSTILQLTPRFREAPPGVGRPRTLNRGADAVQSHGLDLKSPLSTRGTGLYWAAMEPGESIPKAEASHRTHATIVQVTNLGITVKDSPQSTLVRDAPRQRRGRP